MKGAVDVLPLLLNSLLITELKPKDTSEDINGSYKSGGYISHVKWRQNVIYAYQ